MLLIALALLTHLLLGGAIKGYAHLEGRGHEVPAGVALRGVGWGAVVITAGTGLAWAVMTLLGQAALLRPVSGAGLLWLALASLVLPMLWWGGWVAFHAPRQARPGEPVTPTLLDLLRAEFLTDDSGGSGDSGASGDSRSAEESDHAATSSPAARRVTARRR